MMKITLFALFAGLVIMVITVISLVYKEAHAWWSVAEANGHQKAAKDLGIVTKKEMSKEQIADAQSLSIEIQKRIEANAENKPDLSNTVPSKDPIKSAVEFAKLQDRNGYKYLPITDKPYSGWAKGTYDNGQVKYLSQFKEGYVVLKTVWYKNGQKKWEANYKDGRQDGLATSWQENGQKEGEGNWKDGKEEGLKTVWYENEQKKWKGNYKDGKKDGLNTSWHENGQKKREVNYKDGKQDGLATWWNKDGVKSSIPAINRSKVPNLEEVIERIDSLQGDIKKSSRVIFKPGENFTVPDLGLDMIWVKPGTFMMGSPTTEARRYKDEIQHQVKLTKGFYLGKYEVTQAQWERVMGNNPSKFKGADRPVEHVSWNDVVEFCKKLTEMEKKAGRVPQGMSYQLPTEAQWEYACRAGTSTMYSWGDSISSSNANYDENVDETTPVGKYPANPWGFHDMHGNVWEWCADWYADYPSGSVTDPIGPASGSSRVIRGASWTNGRHMTLRSADRLYYPSYRTNSVGFRVVFLSSK